MRRRDLVTLLGGTAVGWPFAAQAQQGEPIRRIGAIIGFARNDPEVQSYVNAFDQGLRELGWTDGRNVGIDYRYAAGDITEMRRLTREMVALRPDLIFASSTPITVALHQETPTIPVVFAVVSDPVGAGLVASLSRPGGNMTGLLNVEASMGGKWVELLNEVAPGLQRVVTMFNPDTAPGGGSYFAQAFEDAARSFKLEPISAPVHEVSNIEDVISRLRNEPRGGLVVVTDSFTFVHRTTIISQTARHRVPAVYPNRVWARDGGLLSYGASNIDLFRRAALYVDRILRGAKPGELPVEVPTKFELLINLKTAKALGIDMPPMLLARADEAIE
jgi:putative tryptophan/tyrosine transport system substrate-binding protein